MNAEFTLEELATAVRDWCETHRIAPANGQSAVELSERTIRYYRTIGLLDAPLGSYVKTFATKHRLQLIAIRIYQAQGIPLRKIREELYGKSEENLAKLVAGVERAGKADVRLSVPFAAPSAVESWSVAPLSHDFLLVSRAGRQLPSATLHKINQLIETAQNSPSPRQEIHQN